MWVLLLTLSLLCAPSLAAQSEEPPAQAEQPAAQAEQPAAQAVEPTAQVEDPMVKADVLYQQRGDLESLKQAVKMYEDITAREPNNYEAQWRLARCLYFLCEKTADRQAKQGIALRGVETAKKAVALEKNKAEGHFWLGVCHGIYGEAKGVMKSLSLVGPIKTEMGIVLRIDPNCEGGGPDRVLGRMYYRLPWIAGGSKKKSLEYLLKSLQLAPANTLTKLYLADTYWSLGQKDKAKKELEEVLTIKADPRWLPETEEDRKEAQRRLGNIARGKKPSEEEED